MAERGELSADERSDPDDRVGEMREPIVVFAMEQHLGHRTYYENLRAHADDAGCRAVWVPVTYEPDPRLARVPLPGSVRSALAARREVRDGLAGTDADAHVFNTQVPAVLGGSVARSRPYVVVTDVTPKQYDRMADGYGHRPDRRGPVGWTKHELNRRTLAGAHWCVGWSEWVCDSFVDDYGIDRAKTAAIPPGVDTSVWRPDESDRDDSFTVLFVGGDFQRKGGDRLLRAFSTLPDDAELVVVTKSPVPRTPRVRVIDDLVPNDPRLIDLYRSADVFALPTKAETFGIAAAEAAACGLPVVASLVGGLADIVQHDVSGFLLPTDDDDGLAASLHTLYGRDVRRPMGDAARRHAVEHLDARTNAGRLVALASDAAGRR